MKCAVCGSENILVSTEILMTESKTNETSLLRKLGRVFLIICTCGIWLLVPKRKSNTKTKTKSNTVAICQNCGCKWTVNSN